MSTLLQNQVKLALARVVADRVAKKVAAEGEGFFAPFQKALDLVQPPKPAVPAKSPVTPVPVPKPAVPAAAAPPAAPAVPLAPVSDPAPVPPAPAKPVTAPGPAATTPSDAIAAQTAAAQAASAQAPMRGGKPAPAEAAAPATPPVPAPASTQPPALPDEGKAPNTVAAAVEAANDPKQFEEALKQHKAKFDADRGAITQETAAIADAVVKNPAGSGFGDWVTSNWQNFLIPAGILAFAFGGTVGGEKGDIIGKVLGALAIGAGGYNLYKRYGNITEDPEQAEPGSARRAELEDIQAGIRTALFQQKDDGTKAPFYNPAAAYDELVAGAGGNPEVLKRLEANKASIIQGIQDVRLAAGLGFTDKIIAKLKQGEQAVLGSLDAAEAAQRPKAPAAPKPVASAPAATAGTGATQTPRAGGPATRIPG